MSIPQFVYPSPVDGHQCSFQYLAITCKATRNVFVPVSVQTCFHFSCICSNEMAKSQHRCILTFYETVKLFPIDYTIIHSHQQYVSIPVAPRTCQHFVWSVFLILAILTGMWQYLIMVPVGIFLMTNDVELIFMSLFTTHISFLVNCLFKPFAQFYRVWGRALCIVVFLPSLGESFMYCGHKSFTRYEIFKYLNQVWGLSFHSPNSVFLEAKPLSKLGVLTYRGFYI